MSFPEEAEIGRYAMRNSRGFPVALLAAAALGVGAPLLVAWAYPGVLSPSRLLLLSLPGIFVALVYLLGAEEHRVAGGQGDAVLYPSRLVVPPAWGHTALNFPLSEIELQWRTVRGRAFFTTVSQVDVLTISSRHKKRKLSSRLFADPSMLARLAQDLERQRALERMSAGHEPTAADLHAVVGDVFEQLARAQDADASAPDKRDHLDDIIDKELKEL